MPPSKTLIFVPTYNERVNVGKLCPEILTLGLDADLLFLDDNSPDGTGALLDELAVQCPNLHVIHRSGKLGVGSAHIDGISWAYDHGYTRLTTMDCDFTHSPSDIPRLLARAEDHDVVVGSRWLHAGSLASWNARRRILTNAGHFLTRFLLRMPYDATGAFRVYNLEKIPRCLFHHVSARGYAFFFESLFLLIRNSFTVCEVPIDLPTRMHGQSKMSLRDAARSAFRILTLYLATLFNPRQFDVREPSVPPRDNLSDSRQ
jgi:dolichol-phosphate mannosyltransferase